MADFRDCCFSCALRVTKRNLLAARKDGTMNREFASRVLRRLKSARRDLPHCKSLTLAASYYKTHYFRNNVKIAEKLWKVVDVFMASLEVYNLRRTALPAQLLRYAYYVTENFKIDLRQCRNTSTAVISDHEMLSHVEFRQLLKAAYSVQNPSNLEERIACDDRQHIVWSAIKEGREQVLPRLLRYGVMFFSTKRYSKPDVREFKEALRCLDGHFSWEFMESSRDEYLENFRRRLGWPLHRVITVLRVIQILSFELCKHFDSGSEEPPERKRPRLESSGEDSTSDSLYFRCLRRAFESIPEPFVTSEELRLVFQVACREWDERRQTRIDGAMSKFEKFYPDGAGPLAPRTLQHLSRCQVRENLRQTGALPHGVKRLGLPKKIRKYILLDE